MIDLTPHGRPAAIGENVATVQATELSQAMSRVQCSPGSRKAWQGETWQRARCGGKLKSEEGEPRNHETNLTHALRRD
jgi:hypothetical protein